MRWSSAGQASTRHTVLRHLRDVLDPCPSPTLSKIAEASVHMRTGLFQNPAITQDARPSIRQHYCTLRKDAIPPTPSHVAAIDPPFGRMHVLILALLLRGPP